MGKELHVVSHSHWDREWYMPFEAHRSHLVDLIDEVLEALDTDPAFRHFHLDGHVKLVEDYLEIRPAMREKLTDYIRQGRLTIGPWYVLQDEYLISSEGNVRNMLVGLREAEKYGGAMNIGYFPDAFGNIAQMPQILRGFGMDFAYVGRGQDPIYYENTPNTDGSRSEKIWVSPDGSEVACVFFSHWYHNANEIPADKEEAVQKLRDVLAAAESTASTPYLLGMNGSDHQPVQADIGRVLEEAQAEFPDVKLLHSSLEDYAARIRPLKDTFGRVYGELVSQNTDGWGVLANTASARVYAKQANHRAYTLLEREAEPLSVMDFAGGGRYRDDLLYHAWKALLTNYPHDTICGCSCDEVVRESLIRFEKAAQLAEEVASRAARHIAAVIDFSGLDEGDRAVVVFNPCGFAQDGAVTALVDYPTEAAVSADTLAVYDGEGHPVPCNIRDCGDQFVYWLPAHTFRRSAMRHRFELVFTARDLPSLAYTSWSEEPESRGAAGSLRRTEDGAENALVSFSIAVDGSVRLTDKATGVTFDRLNIFEDVGDAGNEYTFIASQNQTTVRTQGIPARIELTEEGPARITYTITHRLLVLEDGLRGGACTHALVIRSAVSLREGARRLEFRTEIENDCLNHRVRALFISGIETDTVRADSQFMLADRPIAPAAVWTNPDHSERQLAFFELSDSERALLVANRGLMEYEVLRDGQNTMALTLLRGTWQMGDWGVFPTPEAQCAGRQTVEYAVAAGRDGFDLYREGYAFYNGAPRALAVSGQTGSRPTRHTDVELRRGEVLVSALKKAEREEAVILRLYNPLGAAQQVELEISAAFHSAYRANLNEKRGEALPLEDGKLVLEAPGYGILTLLLEK